MECLEHVIDQNLVEDWSLFVGSVEQELQAVL